jgi:hypothetical protein
LGRATDFLHFISIILERKPRRGAAGVFAQGRGGEKNPGDRQRFPAENDPVPDFFAAMKWAGECRVDSN